METKSVNEALRTEKVRTSIFDDPYNGFEGFLLPGRSKNAPKTERNRPKNGVANLSAENVDF